MPAPGHEVDERFTVELPRPAPPEHRVLPCDGHQLLLPQALLAALVAEAPARVRSEGDRQAAVAAEAARELLGALAPGPTEYRQLHPRARGLVQTLLAAGRVAVRTERGALAARLTVRYHGHRGAAPLGAGSVEYTLDDAPCALLIESWFQG